MMFLLRGLLTIKVWSMQFSIPSLENCFIPLRDAIGKTSRYKSWQE